MKNLLTATAIGAMLVAGVAIATQTETPMAPKQPMSKAQMLERAEPPSTPRESRSPPHWYMPRAQVVRDAFDERLAPRTSPQLQMARSP